MMANKKSTRIFSDIRTSLKKNSGMNIIISEIPPVVSKRIPPGQCMILKNIPERIVMIDKSPVRNTVLLIVSFFTLITIIRGMST